MTRRSALLTSSAPAASAAPLTSSALDDTPARDFAMVRVVDEATAQLLLNLSPRTWDRMRARGEAPPATRLSERRIGYRIADLKAWLDARRVENPA